MHNKDMKDKFYTIKDLARMLKMNERTVSSLIKRGIIKGINVGTKKRVVWRVFEGQYLNFLSKSYEETNDE